MKTDKIEILTMDDSVAAICKQRLPAGGPIRVRSVGIWPDTPQPTCGERFVVSGLRDFAYGLGKSHLRALQGSRYVLFDESSPLQGLPAKFSLIGTPKKIHLVPETKKEEFLERFISTISHH